MAALSEKQQKFLQVFMKTNDASLAAREAGYQRCDEKAVSRILAAKGMASALKPQEAATEPSPANTGEKADRETVIAGLLAEATFTGKGATHSARVSAWEKLGRALGIFGDKGKNDNPEEIVIRWQSDSE